jgi:two-component system chemotaxis sensor kinase CheA
MSNLNFNSILDAIKILINKELQSFPYSSQGTGQIIEKISSNKYRVSYQGEDIEAIDLNGITTHNANDTVQLLVSNGDGASYILGAENLTEDDVSFIVIVGSADKKIGVMVDALIGEEDVVIKPLQDQYTITPGIAGASILGDGSVSLIIDVSQLLDLGVKQELNAREEREAATNK